MQTQTSNPAFHGGSNTFSFAPFLRRPRAKRHSRPITLTSHQFGFFREFADYRLNDIAGVESGIHEEVASVQAVDVKYLSESETARQLGMGYSTLRRHRKNNTGPRWEKVAGHVMYRAGDVEMFKAGVRG